MAYGKRLRKIAEGLDPNKVYTLAEAVEFLQKNSSTKFKETLEIAVNLNVDPRKAEQNLRGMVQLPHGTGKTVRVAVFAKDEKVEEAKKAGADVVGSDDLLEKIQKGFMDFDRCIATPDMMGLVGRLGKVLGPRGLMPNPKLGTVTTDVAAAVKAAKSGQVEYRTEKTGIVQAGIGKLAFTKDQLMDNAKFFVDALLKVRPTGIKGSYIKKISLTSTMGVGLKVDVSSI